MKTPFVTLEKLNEIKAKYPTPFYLYDEAGLRERARKIKQAFSWNTGFRQYFAVKATPNPAILKILREEGVFAECSSAPEIALSKLAGYQGSELLFAPNHPLPEDARAATREGALINLDDLTLIDFFRQNGGLSKQVGCRFNPGGEFVVGGVIVGNPQNAKYGFTRPQLTEGFNRLMELGAEGLGLHAYMGGNISAPDYYPELARLLCKTAVELHHETGAKISFINLSGGLSIPYRPEEAELDLDEISRRVCQVWEETMLPAGIGDAALFTELGRYMTGPYGLLVTTAIHEKHIYKEYIGLDASAANLMRPAIYGAYHHITVMGRENEPISRIYDVVGSVCENTDKFAVDRQLPEIKMGDILVIHDAGAHGHSMGYNYNGKLRCAELLLKADGSVSLIRRAETVEDYLSTLVL